MFKSPTLKQIIATILSVAMTAPSYAAIPASAYAYNANGQVASVTEGDGQVHRFEYNAWDLVSGYRPPSPTTAGYTVGRVALGYGRTQSLNAVTDTKGVSTQRTRNGLLDVVSSTTSPDSGNTSYTHDVAGNLKTVTTPLGVVMTYAYDAANRPTVIDQKDGTVSFSYIGSGAGAGEVGTMTDTSGQSAYGYDVLNRLTARTHTVSGPGTTQGATLGVTQSWSAGRLVSRTYPSGKTVTFAYDAENLASISVNGVPVITNIAWEPFGPASSWQMGSVGTYSRVFDTAGRIVSHTHGTGTRQLTWDASNRLTSLTNPDGTQFSYNYDGLNRMKWASEGGPSQSFKFDANGNRTELSTGGVAYAYGVETNSNRATYSTGPGGQVRNYQHDVGGRLLTDGSRYFTWTNAGYLATATQGATTAQYAYNGLGQRVRKTVGTESRYYVYDDDGLSLLGEYVQSSAGGPVSALNEIVYLDGVPVLVMRGNAVYYVQPDHLGTPRTIRDAAGTVVWSWASDAFGNGTPNQNPGGVFLFEFNGRMPGQQFDAETGLFYNNARYYDPVVGRYISSDPIGLAGGTNTFGYTKQSPVSAADPTGNFLVFAFPLFSSVSGAGWSAVAAVALPIIAYSSIPAVRDGVNAAATAIPRPGTPQVFVTYERVSTTTGQYYCGRTSGWGDPDDVARRVMFTPRHLILTSDNFSKVTGAERFSYNPAAIRGREQQLIDYHGGAESVGGTSRNKINGVSDLSYNRPMYMDAARVEFQTLPDTSPVRPRRVRPGAGGVVTY